MRETGQIIDIHQGFAEIQMNAKGACPSCSAAGMCRVTGTADRKITLPVNGLKLKPGDYVDIDTPARSLLSAAFLIFILPLIISGLAYAIVSKNTDNQGMGLTAFFVFFAVSEFLVLIIDKWVGRSQYFEPKIIQKTD